MDVIGNNFFDALEVIIGPSQEDLMIWPDLDGAKEALDIILAEFKRENIKVISEDGLIPMTNYKDENDDIGEKGYLVCLEILIEMDKVNFHK